LTSIEGLAISIAPYELKPRARLNCQTGSAVRVGALLRVEKNGVFGFSDIHPWPELDDPPLARQLTLLRNGIQTRLTSRSLTMALEDQAAREQSKSAFAGLIVPQSHKLVTDLAEFDSKQLEQSLAAGFSTFKIKVGRDLKPEAEQIKQMFASVGKCRLRLDFNARAELKNVVDFCETLGPETLKRIQFLEDPLPWSNSEWSELRAKTSLSLALDLIDGGQFNDLSRLEALEFSWLVIKPAVQNPQAMTDFAREHGVRIAVTSYLDHPVGQMGAALEAARLGLGPDEVCGLLSQTAYESNEFSEALQTRGPALIPSRDHGIGFSELLKRQDWREL
jgi:O-succinylbenzoate synthase